MSTVTAVKPCMIEIKKNIITIAELFKNNKRAFIHVFISEISIK